MQSLLPHADWLLVDAGNQPSELTARLWSAADTLLVATSPDAVAVMDTYALVKTLLSRHSLHRELALVVNQAAGEAMAADVHRRIDQSCRRFLGLPVEFAGWLPNVTGAHDRPWSGPLVDALLRIARHAHASEQRPRQERKAA
jgi:MinD-like ATPase involved in chromosome partitioning or flagellar assembly